MAKAMEITESVEAAAFGRPEITRETGERRIRTGIKIMASIAGRRWAIAAIEWSGVTT
jgi:hypothetical protein